jgi:hypothetical protein
MIDDLIRILLLNLQKEKAGSCLLKAEASLCVRTVESTISERTFQAQLIFRC